MSEWFKKWFQRPVMIEAPPTMFEEPTGINDLDPSINMGAARLGIIVGHSEESPGFAMAYTGMTEFQFNKRIALLAESYAKKFPKISVTVIYRKKDGVFGAYNKARQMLCDAVVELHFNAADGSQFGTTTYSTADLSDVEFAQQMHNTICMAMDRKGQSCGVTSVSKSVMGAGNVHSFPGGVNCLVMPFFGDHSEDAKLGAAKQTAYASALIDGFALWARKADLLKS